LFVQFRLQYNRSGDSWVTRDEIHQDGDCEAHRRAKPAIHWNDDLGGFGLRIYPSGEASYVVDYRLKGSRRKRRVVVGKPTSLSLDEATKRAKQALEAAREGVDLDRVRRAEIARAEEEERRKARRLTVAKAVAAYLEAFETAPSKRSGRRPASSSLRSTNAWLKRLVAMCGETALEDLTPKETQAVLTSAPQSSRRNVFGALKRLAAWLMRQGLIQTSPLKEIDPPARPASRERTPSPAEVNAILAAADALHKSGRWRQAQRDGIWLLALTAQRRAEVAGMGWEDIDFAAGEWRQPGMKNKTRITHVVPLGRRALDLLKRAHEAAALARPRVARRPRRRADGREFQRPAAGSPP
jgi:integrase